MASEYFLLLRGAFNEYLQHIESTSLEPHGQLLTYDFDFLENRKWHGLAQAMIGCELRELTNLVNQWNNSLCRWHAWSLVLKGRDEMAAWELRSEFLDSLAHECLLRPSSIRDTLTSVATNAFHQLRLSTDRSYPDYLKGDPTAPGKKPKNLRREQKENRLFHLAEKWPSSAGFLDQLRKINTADYINVTSDYRNLTSHTIGPRLGIGYTRTVTRSVEQATRLEPVEGSRYVSVPVPGKMVVSYGYGGTPSLDLEVVRAANLEQYQVARDCYMRYRSFLEVAVAEIEEVDVTA